MDTAKKVIVEWEDHEEHSVTGSFDRPLDLHEVSDYLIAQLGKRPSRLEIIGGVAFADY